MAPVNELPTATSHLVNNLDVPTEEGKSSTLAKRLPLCENMVNNEVTESRSSSGSLEGSEQILSYNNPLSHNKENCFSPSKFQSPKSKVSSFGNSNDPKALCNLSYLANVCETQSITPKKKLESNNHEAPLTPTTNLKMLFSAVSPELRRRDLMREEMGNRSTASQSDYSQQGSPEGLLNDSNFIQDADSGKMFTTGSRKEKSLGLLCQKFLAKYPIYPKQHAGIDISLDEVARDLAVERRRIYDIVNVLESVEIVSRVAKNKYAWHGKTNLANTLAKLKALAEKEGFREQMNRVKEYEVNKELDDTCRPYSSPHKCHLDSYADSDQGLSSNLPKFLEKSLGIMSQKFLMLFLVLKPKTVNLDLAAKVLIGEMTVDKTENSKFKTKIRRLYDIANILTSLDLIRKVHVTEIRGRKPAFKYIGPEVDNTTDINICSTDGCHRPSSRHSLLDCVKNQKIAHILNKPGKPALLGDCLSSRDDMFSPNRGSISARKSFSRHASFDSICEVAEKERTKLFSSQPSSPQKEKNIADWNQCHQARKENNAQHIIWVQKGNEIHEYHVIPSPSHPVSIASVSTTLSAPPTVNTAIMEGTATPVGSVNLPLSASHSLLSHSLPITSTTNAIIPGAEGSHSVPHSLVKHSTSNNLTPQQMEAVLKSLKDPIPVTPNLSASLVDASTQSSPSSIQSSVKGSGPVSLTPVESADFSEPAAKKQRLQDNCHSSNESNQSDGFGTSPDKSENSKRQSPIRALHLEPEFQTIQNDTAESYPELAGPIPEKDDLTIPFSSDTDTDDKSFKAILLANTAAATSTPKGCSCKCCMTKHSLYNGQPGTPKLMHISNQTSSHSVVQLPLLAVASVSASPARVTNSFAYTNADLNSTLASISTRGMNVHPLSSPHMNIVMPVTFTSSPIPIGITDNSQSSPTLVAFPVSQQPTMTLASVQLMQPSCHNSIAHGNVHLKTPTPLTIHSQTSTPGSQISFQSPRTMLDDLAFATPGSFFRNTPNPSLDHSSSRILTEFKRIKPPVLTLEKQSICASSAARRLNLIESP